MRLNYLLKTLFFTTLIILFTACGGGGGGGGGAADNNSTVIPPDDNNQSDNNQTDNNQSDTNTTFEAPTNITLSNTSIDENNAANSAIGTLSTQDVDSDTFTYTLVTGDGDTDNSSFTISGSELQIIDVADYETKSSYSIRINSNDGTNDFAKSFTITINDINETVIVPNQAPTNLTLSSSTIDENNEINATVGTLTTTDSDDTTWTYSLVSGNGDDNNSIFFIDGDNLKIKITTDYEIVTSYKVRIETKDDSNDTFSKAFTINVGDLDDIDRIPEQFSFTSLEDVEKNKYAYSGVTPIRDINSDVNLTITTTSSLAKFCINCEAGLTCNDNKWESTSRTINKSEFNDNNFSLQVCHVTSKHPSVETNTTISISEVNATFSTVTTQITYQTAIITTGYPIKGITIESPALNDSLSDVNGTFAFEPGTLTFKINNSSANTSLTLGQINSDDINNDGKIMIQEIIGNDRNNFTNADLSKLVVLLHSLDEDDNLNNNIELSTHLPELNGSIASFSIDEIRNDIISQNKSPHDRFDAMHTALTKQKTDGVYINNFVTYPEQNETNIAPYTIIKVGFGEDMNSSTIIKNNVYLSQNQNDINFSRCDYNNTQTLLVCTVPTSGLNENNDYNLSLTSNIKTTDDNITSQLYTFSTGQKSILPFLQTGVSGSFSFTENGSQIDNSTSDGTLADDSYYVYSNFGINRSFDRNTTSNEEYVIDNNTTLIWQDDSNISNNELNWSSANSYCSNLNQSGYDDWRLPSVNEFALIANKGDFNQSIFTSTFSNTVVTNSYWTKTLTDPQSPNQYYTYSYLEGSFVPEPKTGTKLTQCVRGNLNDNSIFIRDAINEIVIEGSSGLMWQDNSDVLLAKPWFDSNEPNPNDAIKYCAQLSLGGYSDWRLPNYNELISLISSKHYNQNHQYYYSNVFKYMQNDTYWSSTTYKNDTTDAWYVNFSSTFPGLVVQDKQTDQYVRCVRGSY